MVTTLFRHQGTTYHDIDVPSQLYLVAAVRIRGSEDVDMVVAVTLLNWYNHLAQVA